MSVNIELRLLVATVCEASTISISGSGIPFLQGGEDVNGHYWLTGTPEPLTPKVACLDYSAGKGGPLCAYRWQGESELRAEHFVTVA